MQIGSLVQCVTDFSHQELQTGMKYPENQEMLVICGIEEHGNADCRKKEIVLLTFEEYPDLHGICDKRIDNTPNFVELQPPAEELMHDLFSDEIENTVLVTNMNEFSHFT